jgi:hypothetical protein
VNTAPPPDLADAAAALLEEYDPRDPSVSPEAAERLRLALGDFLAEEELIRV